MKHVGRGAAPIGLQDPIDQPQLDDQLPRTPAELKAAYRYQFTQDLYGESYPAGWFPVFARVCQDIDAMGAERLGFRWAQLKEKFGSARWYGSYAGPLARTESGGPSTELLKIAAAIMEASDQTGSMCMVCGELGQLDQSRGWVLTLCEKHTQERAQRDGAYPECDLPPGPTFDEELSAVLEKSGRAIRFVKPQELLDAMGDIRYDAGPLNRALDEPALAFIRNPEMNSADLMHEYRTAILDFMPFGDLSIDAAETAARLFHEFNVQPAVAAASRAKKAQDDGSVVLFVDIDGVMHPDMSPPEHEFSCIEVFERALSPYRELDIVITGRKRLSMGLDRIRSRFSAEFANKIVGVTPDLSGEEDAADPELERTVWMAKNRSATPAQENRWIGVGPLRAFSGEEPVDRVLLVSPQAGFTYEDGALLQRAIEVKLEEARASGVLRG